MGTGQSYRTHNGQCRCFQFEAIMRYYLPTREESDHRPRPTHLAKLWLEEPAAHSLPHAGERVDSTAASTKVPRSRERNAQAMTNWHEGNLRARRLAHDIVDLLIEKNE